MKKYIILLTTTFYLFQAHSQSFQVKKIKGRQALIEITQGQLEVDQEYSLKSNRNANQVSRGMLVGIEGANLMFRSRNSDSNGTTSSNTTFDLQTTFGWNFGHFEVGPKFSFTTSNGGVTTSNFGAGAFLDYNFQPNRIGESVIWGAFAAFSFATMEAGGSKSTDTTADAGGFMKWFPFNEWLCLRVNLKAEYSEAKTDVSTNKSTSFILNGGVATYF